MKGKTVISFICIFGITLLFYKCDFFSTPQVLYPRYVDSPYIKELSQFKKIQCDSIYLRYPYRIDIKDSLAVILDLHPETYFLHAFTYPDWTIIASFGKRGNGPDEIISAERVRICSSDSVWVLDSNHRKITRWCVSISDRHIECVEEISLDKRLIRTLDFCKIDSGFFITDYSGYFRYHILDSKGKIKKSVDSIPSERYIMKNQRIPLAQAWRSFMDYNSHNKVLAMVTQLGEVVEIFNLQTGSHTVCYGPNGEPIFSISQREAIPKGIKGFNEVIVADNCIYAVFDGIQFKERIRAFQSGQNLLDGGKYIYVFSLTGKLLYKYCLPYSILGLKLKDGKLYAVSTDNDIPIIEYKF